MEFVYGTLTYPATADATNALIGGLPVTVVNQPYAQVPGPMASSSGAFLYTYTDPNSTTFYIASAPPNVRLKNAALSGNTIWFNFSYPIN
jgi:hypothetical protein